MSFFVLFLVCACYYLLFISIVTLISHRVYISYLKLFFLSKTLMLNQNSYTAFVRMYPLYEHLNILYLL